MKRRTKFFALLLSAVMTLGVCAAAACGEGAGSGNEGENPGPGEQQQPTPEVRSVAIKYGDSTVEGLLSANLTTGTMELIPVVTADAGAEYTLTWTSSEPDVATVSGDKTKATLTLNGPGETAIKADTGKKSAEFVLSVEDDRPKTQYTITVVDGVAKNADGETITKAEAGTQVTLEATTPAHKTFTEWTFDNKDVSLNGLSFTMPASNVTATANFTDTLYPLTLVGAKVTKAGDVSDPQGTEGTGDTAQTKTTTYSFVYGTELTIKAAEAEEGKTFVGWDYQVENNRVGEMGVDEYTFTMGDAAATKYTAIYSNFSKKVFTQPADDGIATWCADVYNVEHGSRPIPTTEDDPDLQGMYGYKLAIPGNRKMTQGFPENLVGSEFSTKFGSRGMGKVIFKNHSETTLKLEVYASYAGILSTSGAVEIGPNEVVEKNFSICFNISNSWWGLALRSDLEGEESDWINVDMVVGVADKLYPNSDPMIDIGSDAQKLTFGSEYKGPNWKESGNTSPRINVNADYGFMLMAAWGVNFGASAEGRWDRFEITNMPAYSAGNQTVIYGRCINMAANSLTDPKAEYKIAVSTDENDPTKGVITTVSFTTTGETSLFKLEIPRSASDEHYYLFIIKETLEDATNSYGYGFVMHLTYNNVLGYTEA